MTILKDKYKKIGNLTLLSDGDKGKCGTLYSRETELINVVAHIQTEKITDVTGLLVDGVLYDFPHSEGDRVYTGEKWLILKVEKDFIDFDKSKTKIINNDKIKSIINKLTEYYKTTEFSIGVINSVNSLDLTLFKDFIHQFVMKSGRGVSVWDNEVRGGITHYYEITRMERTEYDVRDFVHSETGLSLNSIVSGVPKIQKPIITYREEKGPFFKSPKYSLSQNPLGEFHVFSPSYDMSLINKCFDKYLSRVDKASSFTRLILKIITVQQYRNISNITFVTDIETSDDVKRSKYYKKALVRFRSRGKSNNEYDSIVSYTKHSKAEIEEMLQVAGLENLDIEVYTIQESISAIKEYNKNK